MGATDGFHAMVEAPAWGSGADSAWSASFEGRKACGLRFPGYPDSALSFQIGRFLVHAGDRLFSEAVSWRESGFRGVALLCLALNVEAFAQGFVNFAQVVSNRLTDFEIRQNSASGQSVNRSQRETGVCCNLLAGGLRSGGCDLFHRHPGSCT